MPYYGPNEERYTNFLERTFMAAILVDGVGYGMQIILYLICTRYLWRERKKRASIFLLAYITLLLGLSLLSVSAATWTVQDTYINNRNYPGGPWIYFITTGQNSPENVIFIVTLFVLTFLSDILMIWRCWVIWTSSTSRPLAYVVVAFPFLILLASFALGIIWILQSYLPGLSLYSKTPIAFGTSYYVTSLGVNITVTILITLRLASYRRDILESLPPEHAAKYFSLAAIFVESAALYSAVALTFIIAYALNNPINLVFLGLSPASQQIASYLIILRVAQGRAWSTDTLAGTTGVMSQLSAMQFSAPITNAQVDSDFCPNQRTLSLSRSEMSDSFG